MSVSDAKVDDLRSLMAALPAGEDLPLLVLKGHLVVEQLLNHYIEVISSNPKPILELKRLAFGLRARVAQSMYVKDKTLDQVMWTPVRQLNELRNSIAHELEPKELQRQVDDFITRYECPGAWRPDEYESGSRVVKLRFAIAGLHKTMAGFITLMRLNRMAYGSLFTPDEILQEDAEK
jgi:hypothetical protein